MIFLMPMPTREHLLLLMRPGLTWDSGGDISDAGRNTKYEARIWYIINIMMEMFFNPMKLDDT